MIPNVRAAALLYTKESSNRDALAEFARELITRGWRVGGLVQEVFRAETGHKTRVDIIDVATGDRIPINRPSKAQILNKSCSLDVSALAQSTAVLRQAIADRVDLLVVEKFGEQEQNGGGLAEEILTAMAEGIATVVAVPAGVIDTWDTFSGGSADLLPCSVPALWRWWGARNLRRELIRAVDKAPARRVIVGLNWTLVEGPDGCGLAHTPQRTASGCQAVPQTAQFSGQPLDELARLANACNPFEAAIGVAAINAHYNRRDLTAGDTCTQNGLAVFSELDGPVTVIGRFPDLARYLPEARVVEQDPQADEYPPAAASRLLRESEAAVITASALVNHSLEDLLPACASARVALVGPGTPLAPCLHAYGIEVLAGQVVEDVEGAARVVAEGGSIRALKPFTRPVTLTGS